MVDLIGSGLGSPDIWLIPSLILAVFGLLIAFNNNVRSIIGGKISVVNRNGGIVAILFIGLAVFFSSSRAFYLRRKMKSDLVGTYGCERSQFYDCRDLIFASSLPIATLWLAAAALIIWYVVTMMRDSNDSLAITAQRILPISLFIMAGLSVILIVINYISNGLVLAPYTLMCTGLLGLAGWMVMDEAKDESSSS